MTCRERDGDFFVWDQKLTVTFSVCTFAKQASNICSRGSQWHQAAPLFGSDLLDSYKEHKEAQKQFEG